MKKFKKILSATLFTFVFCLGSVIAFAQARTDSESLKIGETIEFDGEEYTVYLLDEDGIHITKNGIAPIAGLCPPHNYILQPGSSVVETKINNSSTDCYVKKTYVRSTCSRCGDTIVSLKSSSTIKHKYSLFGKACTNTPNGKECTYVKP